MMQKLHNNLTKRSKGKYFQPNSIDDTLDENQNDTPPIVYDEIEPEINNNKNRRK